MKRILLIGTGGTIASEMTDDGLAPKLGSNQLLNYIPRVSEICSVECFQLMSVDSTNMTPADWLDIARALREAGKQPVLSTMVLLESGSDVAHMLKIARNGEFAVEAGDMGAAHAMSAQKLPFIAGPHLNLFNADALDWIHGLGAALRERLVH